MWCLLLKHFHDLVVLTTHTPTNMLTYQFKIDKGLITEVGVFFPPGCHGRVYAKVYFQAHQILPRNQENWCHGNNDWWRGLMYFAVTAAPLEVKVEAWADNTNYDHTITVALELTPWRYVPAWDKMIALLSSLLKFVGAKLPTPTVEEEMMIR